VEDLSCSHCCRGKAANIGCSKRVSVDLTYPACQAHSPFYIPRPWPVWPCHIFPHYLINGAILFGGGGGGGVVIKYEMCVDFLYKF
jgi:hypothetical protein